VNFTNCTLNDGDIPATPSIGVGNYGTLNIH
jgi:hypothetical protein